MPGNGNGQITVDVGVKLQVLQSSINEMKKILGDLEPDSSGFKKLQRIISDITKEMDRLQVQTSKSFGSQAQFNQTEKTIDKIEESLTRAKLAVDNLNFKDIKLDANQQAQFTQLTTQLQDLEKQFLSFKELTKQQLFNDLNFKKFADTIDPQLMTKNFDEVAKTIESKTKKINDDLQKSKEVINLYERQLEVGTNIKSFLNGGGLTKEGLGEDIFNKFFVQATTGLKFKSGQKEEFYKYMQDTFALDANQLNSLKDLTASQVQKVLTEAYTSGKNKGNLGAFFDAQLKNANTAGSKQSNEIINNQKLSDQYGDAAAAMAVLVQAYQAIGQEEGNVSEKTNAINAAFQQLQNVVLNTVKSHQSFSSGLASSNSQLDSFRQQLAGANAEFLKLQRQQAAFNSLKMTITNFMGFNQVLNLTKRAIKEATNHIKELDSMMNSISIVTDMNTQDLWKQVDAYSEMAQNFGVTIEGAYEVSKIYYQQGMLNI